jgi:predicted exporter
VTRALAVAWAVVVAALVAHQVHLFRGGLEVETNLLALLPADERDAAAEQALARLAEASERAVVVLLGAQTEALAVEAAERFIAAVPADRLRRLASPPMDAMALAPWRDRLLTPAQRERLMSGTVEELTQRALLQLQQPVAGRIGDFRDDPLQLFPEWLRERAGAMRVRPSGSHLIVEDGGRTWVVLRFELVGSAFSLDGEPHVAEALATGRAALPAGAEALAAGVPLFAESAAVQASREVSTVGLGSLVAILLVMVLAFRSPRPLLLVVLSVGLGVACGLSVTALVFGRVHLMTLVFGASLVGVAEDYGIHYFASRQAHPGTPRVALLRELRPGLLLATLTSVAGYAMLAIAPLPGLRQVAVFSAAGLTGAFLTVLAWYPVLDRGEVRRTAFASAWASTRARWPRLSGRLAFLALALLLLFIARGLAALSVDDDVRALQASPPALLDAQRRVATLVGLPSPAQFFLVRGRDETERLHRERQLVGQLEALAREGALAGAQAVSDWVPPEDVQASDQALFTARRADVLRALADELDDATPPAPSAAPLRVDDLLATSAGEALRPLWLDDASVVLLHAPARDALPRLAALGALPGVRFVDRTAEMSALLGRWRGGMAVLLALGVAVVFAALWWRYRRRAWRALAPTVLAGALALATVGFLGEPLTLFHVLALWLLLGMGVDYGIFLLEHPSRVAGEAWLAVGLGAVSTLLSFGLLATSSTPAIHAFGVTLGVGIAAVWALSPAVVDRDAR